MFPSLPSGSCRLILTFGGLVWPLIGSSFSFRRLDIALTLSSASDANFAVPDLLVTSGLELQLPDALAFCSASVAMAANFAAADSGLVLELPDESVGKDPLPDLETSVVNLEFRLCVGGLGAGRWTLRVSHDFWLESLVYAAGALTVAGSGSCGQGRAGGRGLGRGRGFGLSESPDIVSLKKKVIL